MINECYIGDVRDGLRTMAAAGVRAQTCITSPPYWGLRDYGTAGQIGLEPTIGEYVETMVAVFRLVRDVLADDGTLWLNLGDSYSGSGKGPAGNLGAVHDERNLWKTNGGVVSGNVPDGLKPKDLCGIPWRIAFALQADGWWLRQDIIWAKPNPMPESVTDRCTKAHEYLFLLSKRERYYYDAEAIAEPFADERRGNPGAYKWKQGSANVAGGGPNSLHKGNGKVEGWNVDGECQARNRRSVWSIATEAFADAHFATFPTALIEPCILAGSRPGDIVLDPFMGSGTVAKVAQSLGRRWVGCELNPTYVAMQRQRAAQTGFSFA